MRGEGEGDGEGEGGLGVGVSGGERARERLYESKREESGGGHRSGVRRG